MLVAQPILFMLLPIVLFIRMALNALDGMLARECNQQTRFGAILNETGDVISDIALYLPFLFLPERITRDTHVILHHIDRVLRFTRADD